MQTKMKTSGRSAQDKAVTSIGTSRQEAERIVKAKLHSMAESFTLTPQN
jgi:hypothetical protein